MASPRAGPKPARRAVRQWLLTLVVVGVALVGIGTAAGQDEDADELDELDEADTSRGSGLFTENCAQCHGPAGQGGELPDGRKVPGLADRDRVTLAYVRLTLDTGRMPPAGDPFDNRQRRVWPAEDRRDVLAYMAERFELEGDVEAPTVADPQRGLEVYAANCANCHGAAATGGNAGRTSWTPSLRGLEPQTIADAVRTGPFAMPAFDSDYLDDDDVGAVAAFLEAVEEERFAFTVGTEVDPATTGSIIVLIAAGALIIAYIVGSPARRLDQPTAGDEESREDE